MLGGAALQGQPCDFFAQPEKTETGHSGRLGQKAGFGHAGNRVGFEDKRYAVGPQENVDPRVNFQPERAVRGKCRLLHQTGLGFVEWRGTEVFGSSLGVLVCVIVKPFVRTDLDHCCGLVANHPDRQFAPFHQFFDQNFPVQCQTVGQCSLQLRGFAHEVHADAGPLARSFDHDWQGQSWLLARPEHLPARGGNPGLRKKFFALQLVEGHTTGCLPFSGVRNSTAFKDGLDLTILSEGSVHHEKTKSGVLRQSEFRPVHINLAHAIATLAQCVGHRRAGAQGNLALRSGTAHKDGKMQGS